MGPEATTRNKLARVTINSKFIIRVIFESDIKYKSFERLIATDTQFYTVKKEKN